VRAAGHQYFPETGPLSWSVPGCVRGWEDLRSRFGTLSLGEILAPAIDYAQNGFPVSPAIALGWQGSARTLSATPEATAAFLIADGDRHRGPAIGEMMRNKRMAATLKLVAEKGPDEFYRGAIARQ